MSHNHCIATVGNVVCVFETLQDESGGLSLRDLALRTGYAKGFVRRLSEKHCATGYVQPHHGEFTLIEDTNQPIFLSKEG